VQSGPRNARSDAVTGIRFYTWKGTEYPSVTSIRRVAGLPHMLAAWQVNEVIARAMTDFKTLERMLHESTPEATKKWLWQAVTAKRDAAGDLGKRVHDAASEGKTLDQVGHDVAPFLIQYRSFLADTGLDILLTERQVWSLKYGYAGTFDMIGRFPNGQLWLIDLKTGKGTYTEHALQLEAYGRADFVGEDDEIDDVATALLRKVHGHAVLHLTENGWSFKAIPSTEQTWIGFRGLLAFARWTLDHPNLDTLTSGVKSGSATPT
jgi:hypothetical protein